jgi:hypothetical protein
VRAGKQGSNGWKARKTLQIVMIPVKSTKIGLNIGSQPKALFMAEGVCQRGKVQFWIISWHLGKGQGANPT